MSWSKVASVVGKSAPILGSLLGGSVGEKIGTLIATTLGVENSPESVSTALQANPEYMLKLVELENSHKVKLQELSLEELKADLQFQSQVSSDVNKTIQTEATSDHWPSYSWRPFIGFSFGLYIMSMWVLPLFKVVPVTLSPDLTLAIGAILGVASFFRGKAQADPNVNISDKG